MCLQAGHPTLLPMSRIATSMKSVLHTSARRLAAWVRAPFASLYRVAAAVLALPGLLGCRFRFRRGALLPVRTRAARLIGPRAALGLLLRRGFNGNGFFDCCHGVLVHQHVGIVIHFVRRFVAFNQLRMARIERRKLAERIIPHVERAVRKRYAHAGLFGYNVVFKHRTVAVGRAHVAARARHLLAHGFIAILLVFKAAHQPAAYA